MPGAPAALAALLAAACSLPVLDGNRAQALLKAAREAGWWRPGVLKNAVVAGEGAVLGEDYGPTAEAPEYGVLAAGCEERRLFLTLLRLPARAALVTLEADGEAPALLRVRSEPGHAWEALSFADLQGARIGEYVVLVHAGRRSARSSVSFHVPGSDRLKYVVAGLGAGVWEIWHNGWLVEPMADVAPGSQTLFFTGDAGSYFLRRRG